MRYSITYHTLVVKYDIPALSKAYRIRIQTAIQEKLIRAPEIFGKPLRTSLRGYRSLRVGDYRIIFLIQKETVRVLAIIHRSTVYEDVVSRIH